MSCWILSAKRGVGRKKGERSETLFRVPTPLAELLDFARSDGCVRVAIQK